MKNFLRLLLICASAFFAPTTTADMSGIQSGSLRIQNTLNEPVQYQVSTILNGSDPATGLTMKNCRASSHGAIPAQGYSYISSGGFNLGGKELWGSIITVSFKRQGDAMEIEDTMEIEYQLHELGTYMLHFDDRGNLVLKRQN